MNADRRDDGGQGDGVLSVGYKGEGVRFFAPGFEEGGMSRSTGRLAAAAHSAGTRGAMAENLMRDGGSGGGGSGTSGKTQGQAFQRPPDQKTAN